MKKYKNFIVKVDLLSKLLKLIFSILIHIKYFLKSKLITMIEMDFSVTSSKGGGGKRKVNKSQNRKKHNNKKSCYSTKHVRILLAKQNNTFRKSVGQNSTSNKNTSRKSVSQNPTSKKSINQKKKKK